MVTEFYATATIKGRRSGKVTPQPVKFSDADTEAGTFQLEGLTYYQAGEDYDLIDFNIQAAAADVVNAIKVVKDGQMIVGYLQFLSVISARDTPRIAPIGFSANSKLQFIQHVNA
tara:strand:- start:69 stop:413 length:345 start_codon:yes stop_codon:yes gene_type:complete